MNKFYHPFQNIIGHGGEGGGAVHGSVSMNNNFVFIIFSCKEKFWISKIIPSNFYMLFPYCTTINKKWNWKLFKWSRVKWNFKVVTGNLRRRENIFYDILFLKLEKKSYTSHAESSRQSYVCRYSLVKFRSQAM